MEKTDTSDNTTNNNNTNNMHVQHEGKGMTGGGNNDTTTTGTTRTSNRTTGNTGNVIANFTTKKYRWIVYSIFIIAIVIFNINNIFKYQRYYIELFQSISNIDVTNNNVYDQQREMMTTASIIATNEGRTGSSSNNNNNYNNDWYNSDTFHTSFNDTCLVVDNICHSSGRWWYDNTNNKKQQLNQPSFIFHTYLDAPTSSYPKYITVLSSNDIQNSVEQQTLDNYTSTMCTTSPIINHISMFSTHTTMLGEYYLRILRGLYDISQQSNNFTNFLYQTQLYLHLNKENYKDQSKLSLLDSHHLFSNAFRSNPLLNFKQLIDNTNCQCIQRLFLCGYSVTPITVSTTTLSSVEQKPDTIIPIVDKTATNTTSTSSNLLNIVSIGASEGIYPKVRSNDIFNKLRQILLKNTIIENPFMQHDIQKFKQKVILEKNIMTTTQYNNNDTSNNYDDWKIVGLAQRTGRRRWNNTGPIVEECNIQFNQYNIICIIVNVEENQFTPYYQAVVHSALDALYGIHGAQLTEAIWMKSNSLIVEFLPWIHEKLIMGHWTREVQKPTPLGIIFDNTDLNHIGYPLERTSAPYCYGLDKEKEIDCWRGYQWDERDFIAPMNAVIDSIRMFLISNNTETTKTNTTIIVHRSCLEYNKWAADNFVLYNILCYMDTEDSNTTNRVVSVHHMPWKKPLTENLKYTNYSNEELLE